MAKTFKNIQEHKPNEIPNSKKDILDFFEEEGSQSKPSVTKVTSVVEPIIKEVDNTISIVSNETRQTFIIGTVHLEKLKDYVYTQRKKGHFDYTQRNAVEDGIDKLLDGQEILKRPPEVKAKENNRRQKIRSGIGQR
jgi:hypothetical protein